MSGIFVSLCLQLNGVITVQNTIELLEQRFEESQMTKKIRKYANFGEYLYWSYANLQMLHYAVKAGKEKYDRICFMI